VYQEKLITFGSHLRLDAFASDIVRYSLAHNCGKMDHIFINIF